MLCGSWYKPNKTHLSTVITPRIPQQQWVMSHAWHIFCSIKFECRFIVQIRSNKTNLIYTFLLILLGRYICWWTIIPRGYHPHSSQCFYHSVDTSAGGLLLPEGIIRPVVSVSITESIHLLVDYYSPRVPSAQ